MRELGIAVPDAGTVKLSGWQRLQARLAPLDRLLAAREAAETPRPATSTCVRRGDTGAGPAAGACASPRISSTAMRALVPADVAQQPVGLPVSNTAASPSLAR